MELYSHSERPASMPFNLRVTGVRTDALKLILSV